MGDKAATELADVLRFNSTLTELHWHENQITLGGYLALASTLKTNKTLISLDIPANLSDIVGGIEIHC